MFHLYSRSSHCSTDFVYITVGTETAQVLSWTVVGRRKTAQTEENVPVATLRRVYRELRMRGFKRNGR